MEDTNTFAVKNGHIQKYHGRKSMVFAADTLELRDILYCVYSGSTQERGTVQIAHSGDLVVSVKWKNDNAVYEVHIAQSNKTYICAGFAQYANVFSALRKKHPWFDSWLEPSQVIEPVKVPTDVIPETAYLSNKKKRSRLELFLSKFTVPYNVDDFMSSKKEDLNLIAVETDINFDTLRPIEGVDVEWFGISKITKPAQPLKLSGNGVESWRKYRYLVRIEHNLYNKHYANNRAWGKSINVYDLKK